MRASTQPRLPRVLAASVAVAVAACVLPAVADATDYCVEPNPSCPAANTYQHVEDALAKAAQATDADRVLLGEDTYEAQFSSGFGYNLQSSPVEIVGQGEGRTVLTSPPGGSLWVMRLMGGPGSSIHDLTIKIPPDATGGMFGLSTANTARRIEVVEASPQTNKRGGVELVNGATLEDSRVSLPDANTGVLLNGGGGNVRGSAVSAWWSVLSLGDGSIERSHLTSSGSGVVANRGVTTLAGSVIRLIAPDTVGLAVGPRGGDVTLSADGVTIIGSGTGTTDGVDLYTHFAPDRNATVNLTNSIIRGVTTSLRADAIGTGLATINVSYSDYDPSGDGTSGPGFISEANVSNVGDPGFLDEAGGDFHLLPTSALIDRGDPAAAQGLDVDGKPLVADGNGDGSPRRDLGAFELQPSPRPGDPPAADTQAPLVSAFSATPSRFAIAPAGTALSARAPRGSRFRYTVSEDARVRLTIQRALAGRRQAGRCMRPTRQLRRAKRCTRYRTVGSLARNAGKGANSIGFTGKIGRRALHRGRYRAVLTAVDAAGNRSAPRRAGFRIVRR